LCGLLREGVACGALRPGERLPSTRELMLDLGVSRNTVARVYEQLRMEGYVRSHVGSGTYVADTSPDALLQTAAGRPAARQGPGSRQTVSDVMLARRAQAIVSQPSAGIRQWGAFMPGVPDVARFPRVVYARILNRLWRSAPPEMLTYGTAGGAQPLKQAL